MKQKILMITITIITVLSMNCCVLLNSVKAANITNLSEVQLEYGGVCPRLLVYNGTPVKVTYVQYTYNGKSYPAYCLNKELGGVTDEVSYSVNPSNAINDLGLWRVIINGYPYKTIDELGVATKEEAFTATKQAVYCYLYEENSPEDYEAIDDEGGLRTLNALNQILTNAANSTEVPGQNEISIEPESEEWTEDAQDSNYVSKIYSLNSRVKHAEYEITISEEAPEGTKITSVDGDEVTKFSSNDKFKIMLPKDKLTSDGSFTLNIQTEVKTKPVIYGAAPNADVQNYALTAYMYEDATCTYEDTYTKIEKPKEEVPKKEMPEQPKEAKILPVTGM